MSKLVYLKIIFSGIFIFMTYKVIATSLESNLFTEWNFLASIPWMRATLWDFYANVFVIYCWVLYKEKSVFSKIMWLVLLFCLGSIASCAYVLLQLFKLKERETLKDLFIKQN